MALIRFDLFILALLIISIAAHAQSGQSKTLISLADISLEFGPKEPLAGEVFFYQDEVRNFRLSVNNNSRFAVENLKFTIEADKGLVFVEDSLETQKISRSIDRLMPKSKVDFFLKLKSKEAVASKKDVYVTYSLNNNDLLFRATVSTKEVPVSINSTITLPKKGEDNTGKVSFSMANNSNQTIKSISARLLLPSGMYSSSDHIELGELKANDYFDKIELPFFTTIEPKPGLKILLLIEFEDTAGIHHIEKTFDVAVESNPLNVYVMLVVIIGMLVASYLLESKPKKKEQPAQPAAAQEALEKFEKI